MFSYSILQWTFFFYVYSFIGWIIESVIVSLDEKKLVNRGFLRGPYLPIYGFGGIVILFSTLPVQDNPALVYLFGMIGTTLLEYVTGWVMESMFKMKYWDYSGQKFNYKGRISLTSSLFWGFLSLFMVYVLHAAAQKLVFFFSDKALWALVIAISVVFIADSINAFRTALDVNKLLANITRIMEEMEALRVQLTERVENTEYAMRTKNRLQELKTELGSLLGKINFFNTALIKAHPRAYSKHFNNALKTVRKKINERRK